MLLKEGIRKEARSTIKQRINKKKKIPKKSRC